MLRTGEGVNADEGNELFSLAALRGKGSLAEQAEVPAPTEEEMEALEADTDEEEAAEHNSNDSDDSDEDERSVVSGADTVAGCSDAHKLH